MKTDAAQIEKFFRALWPDGLDLDGDKKALCLWTLAGRRSTWCTSIEEAIKHAAAYSADIYAGAALGPVGLDSGQRVVKKNAMAIPGIWADLDYADDAHQKKDRLPPDEDAVLSLLKDLPHRPSLVVHSGHGLQAWWLFEEAWIFDTEEERARGARTVKGWIRFIADVAGKKGWVIDSVFDLARVMRIPGTVNAKSEEHVLARILKEDGPRYNPSDFEMWEASTDDDVTASVDVGDFTIDANASPPFQKMENAKKHDDMFAATWKRKRADFKDVSASAYDLSLATQAAMMGWADQEIVNLMIANRREHGDKPKLREDYFRRTLIKARGAMEMDEAIDELAELNAAHLEEQSKTPPGAEKEDLPADKREDFLRHVNRILVGGVQIVEGIRYYNEPAGIYQFKTTHGDLHDLKIADVLSSAKFFVRVADATGYITAPIKADKWRECAQGILNACRTITIPGMSDGEEMRFLIEAYLDRQRPVIFSPSDSDSQAMFKLLKRNRPLIKNDHIMISSSGISEFLNMTPGFQMRATQKMIGMRIHKLGAQVATVSVRHDGKRKQGRYWVLPTNDFDPIDWVESAKG